jgi:hypothetical protein
MSDPQKHDAVRLNHFKSVSPSLLTTFVCRRKNKRASKVCHFIKVLLSLIEIDTIFVQAKQRGVNMQPAQHQCAENCIPSKLSKIRKLKTSSKQ